MTLIHVSHVLRGLRSRRSLVALACAAFGALSLLCPKPAAAQIAIAPLNLNFGRVDVGKSASLTITSTNVGPAKFKPIPSFQLGDGFEWAVANNSNLKPGQRQTVTVIFKPPVAGDFAGTVTITHPFGIPVTIPVTGTGVGGAAAVGPLAADFGDVLVGARKTVNVTVRNTGNKPLTITGAQRLAAGGFLPFTVLTATPIAVPVGGAAQVAVEFAPTEAGQFNSALRLVSNAFGNPNRLEIPLKGTGNFLLHLNLFRLNFGAVLRNQIHARELTLTNTTDSFQVVHVDAGGLDPGFFHVKGSGYVELAPGQTARIAVSFGAMAPCRHNGTLVIDSEAFPEGRVEIPVTVEAR